MKIPSYYFGVDLGQVADPSALCVLKKTPGLDYATYDVVALERWVLKTSYPAIVERVGLLAARPEIRPLVDHPDDCELTPRGQVRVGDPSIVVDATGVGRAVVGMFLDARMKGTVVPLTITGGQGSREDQWDPARGTRAHWVAKADLVSVVQAKLQTGRLKVAPALKLADVLRKELENFRVRVSKGANELYAAREGEHDDMVLSLAMALWLADRPAVRSIWVEDPFAEVEADRQAPAAPTHRAFDPFRRS